MKKFYLIALCAVISSVAYAQSGSQFANKRLVSFTEESGNSKRKYVMEYDDQGRILKYASEDGNRVHNYTYYGDDEILNDDGAEPITYKLSNGRLVWATIFFDCHTNCDIIYDDNKLKQIVDGIDVGESRPIRWYTHCLVLANIFQRILTRNWLFIPIWVNCRKDLLRISLLLKMAKGLIRITIRTN